MNHFDANILIPSERERLTELLPFKTSLSFVPLIDFMKASLASEEGNRRASFHKEILERLADAPELQKPIEDWSVLDTHKELVDLLMTEVFPSATWQKDTSTAIAPFQFKSFYSNPSFDAIINLDEDFLNIKNFAKKEMLKYKTAYCFLEILSEVYGQELSNKSPMIMRVADKKTGLDKYYQMNFNNLFCKVNYQSAPKNLSVVEIKLIKENIMDFDFVSKYIPPENFSFEGFVVLRLEDITEQEVLSDLKLELLKKDALVSAEQFKEIEWRLKNLFNLPDLRLGLAAFNVYQNAFQNYSPAIWNSFVSPNSQKIACDAYEGSVYERAVQSGLPLVVEDLEKFHTKVSWEQSMEKLIVEQGIRNLLVAPLIDNDIIIGAVELGSPHIGELDAHTVAKLQMVLPLFTLSVKRSLADIQNQVEAIVQKEFTALHPVVAWKFTEAAFNLKEKRDKGEDAEMESIVFHDVFPIYGQTDVRGSSVERNHAIQTDLIEQLNLIGEIIKAVLEEKKIPIFEEIAYRVAKTIQEIKEGLNAGDELSVLDFIKFEIEPLLNHLEDMSASVADAITGYKNALDPELKFIYKRRKAFEQSITKINDAISQYLDKEERIAQEIFPHYFEKYKTDGVEYNIFIGESLLQDQKFNPIYLKNLRLWQLLTMVEITRMTECMKSKLEIPLATTQLILVHSSPLSIRFRQDEKQFDVDGAYNIRYEIVKKRIDKALIKGTNERLTQPGKIAIVYSRDREVMQYRQYIEYLQHRDMLEDEVEYLELEELQGASGLKAIRVSVKPRSAQPTEKVALNADLVKSIIESNHFVE